MIRTRRVFSVVLAVIMVFTLCGYTSFAMDEPAAGTNQTNEDLIMEGDSFEAVDDETADPFEGTEPEAPETDAVEAPETDAAGAQPGEELAVEDGKVVLMSESTQTGNVKPGKPVVKTLAGYKSIKLTWKKVKGAQGYNIGIWNPAKKKYVRPKGGLIASPNRTSYIMKNLKRGKKYTFRVMAVTFKPGADRTKASAIDAKYNSAKGTWSGNVNMGKPVKGAVIERCKFKFKMRSTHKRKGYTFRKGSTQIVEDFSGGKYIAKRNGKRIAIPRIKTRGVKAIYRGPSKPNYSRAEAELFINEYTKLNKVGSKTKYLIFVSSYTQHLYIMKKQSGKWVATKKNWEVSMGKATSPSPTGNKVIQKKVASRHGIRYWNCFSSWNALHGVTSSMAPKLGKLASGGCIRNAVKNAKWIRNNCPLKTRVVIY